MKIRWALLLLCATTVASADISPPGIKRIPIELTLKNQRAFPDATFVLIGCNSVRGRHTVAFPKADAPLTCSLKGVAKVYRTSSETARALRELVDKDVGWGMEGVQARTILEKGARECGEIAAATEVDAASPVEKLFVSYSLRAKGDDGCELVSADAGAPAPSASAPAPAPTPETSTPPAPPAPRSCSGCGVAAPNPTRTLLLLSTLLLFAFARRRPQNPGK
jgi:hypothetical protein